MGTIWSSRLTRDVTRVSCVGHASMPTPTALARSQATKARRRVRSPSHEMGLISASAATAATRPNAYRRIDSKTPILIGGPSSQIDPIDLSYYTPAHGDGPTETGSTADDVDGHDGFPARRQPPVLYAVESAAA